MPTLAAVVLAMAAGVVVGLKVTSGGTSHLTLSGNGANVGPSVSTSATEREREPVGER